jgi:hypothetical protein
VVRRTHLPSGNTEPIACLTGRNRRSAFDLHGNRPERNVYVPSLTCVANLAEHADDIPDPTFFGAEGQGFKSVSGHETFSDRRVMDHRA